MNNVRHASGYVPADSVLATTAREIIAAHSTGADPTTGRAVCRRCGAMAPCPTVRAATQVVAATGAPMAGPGASPSADQRPDQFAAAAGAQHRAPVDLPALPHRPSVPVRSSAPVPGRLDRTDEAVPLRNAG